MNDFELLLEDIQRHFTVAEFVEFLELGWEHLLDFEAVLDVIVDRQEDIKEEMGT